MKARLGRLLDLACALGTALLLLPMVGVITLFLFLGWVLRPLRPRRFRRSR